MTIALEERAGQELVSAELFDRLASRIAKERDMSREFAARIMDQALAFLFACGQSRSIELCPSQLVDLGWHTFILHTREYADFCQAVAGRFLHHVPNDDGAGLTDAEEEADRTTRVISSSGFAVDPELWLTFNLSCNGGDDGCRASGKDGNENTDTNGK
ncbi:hypothetical protein [Amycolatopsis minnesotensis]|uniref:Uncharacterized protein n=1 Tax=Amycolatopsis minnesotensis TaxID=337894 RepID=A0ABN2QVB0_9PSEU